VLTAYDHALTALLAVLFPVWAGTLGFRRLRRAAPDRLPRVRLSVYRAAIALQWTLAAAVLALWTVRHRGWAELGLEPALNGGFIGTAAGLAIVVAFTLHQRRRILTDGEGLDVVRRRLASVEVMMPRSVRELRWFFALSATAGVCEEILYRGYLIWYLQYFLGLIPAAGVAAVVFGIGHSYQGPRGVALTALIGAFLGAVYLVSGSLLVPMLIHGLMDAHSGHLAYVAYAREAVAAHEWLPAGAEPGETAAAPDATGEPSAPPAASVTTAPETE
jgi:membrane protease YdiL (CAAX protease family)